MTCVEHAPIERRSRWKTRGCSGGVHTQCCCNMSEQVMTSTVFCCRTLRIPLPNLLNYLLSSLF